MLRLKLIFYTLCLSSMILIYMVAVSSLPYSPWSFKLSSSFTFNSILPEGWAFFTKDARDEISYVLRKDSKNNWNIVNVPISDYRYIFGLDRKGRALEAELNNIFDQISNDKWTKSVTTINYLDTLIKQKMTPIEIKTIIPNPICIGEIVILSTKPVPWAWAQLDSVPLMPYKFLLVNVSKTESPR